MAVLAPLCRLQVGHLERLTEAAEIGYLSCRFVVCGATGRVVAIRGGLSGGSPGRSCPDAEMPLAFEG